jgi:Fur family ferric uptake transcriptional regulator
MKKLEKIFEEFLEKTGGRNTSQKQSIFEEIYKTRTHFEIESFIDKIRAKDKKFSRATVYRIVKQLLDAGLIQKIVTKEGRVFYERTMDHQRHDHLICNQCGKILEIHGDEIEVYLTKVCLDMGFDQEYRSLHIYGKCDRCK